MLRYEAVSLANGEEIEMTKAAKERKKPATQNSKKRYVRPHLVEYGNVAKLTASGGSRPPADSMTRMSSL